ncbi:DHH family phosphoesterase [Candidatus Woesearchaeota archaeon]|nr:DHH family phosphoesterase [Candidatus Woesearchaeota archaeon]
MKLRIIAHAGCTDGYSSAFIIKRYWQYLIKNTGITEEEIKQAEILPLYPGDLQAEEFISTPGDIIIDLPRPKGTILFWCDHHATAKPAEEKLPKNQFWKITPSCTGYLIDLARQDGLKSTSELLAFKAAMDKIDAAEYTHQEIIDCYYNPDLNGLVPLQKVHALGAMFNTRDRNLNLEIFRTILSQKLGETPLSSEALWRLDPLIFYRAQLTSYREWRENVDTYIEYNEEMKCVVQDDRKATLSRGVPDRFYACIKFPQASYTLSLKPMDQENMRVGLGSNIFHKDRCKVDLGKLCRDIGKRFGKGSGGGHHDVGGAMIKTENADAMIKYVSEVLKKGGK